MVAPFKLLNFPMPKRDWTPEEIEQVHNWLKCKVLVHIIAGNFPRATSGDITDIARLLGEPAKISQRNGGQWWGKGHEIR